ncbi:MAG: hypothetical protein QM817_33850 [Archangium sp.]
MRRAPYLLLLAALSVWSAPPVPTPLYVIDGGWVARRPALGYSLPSNTSPATTGAEIEFLTDLGLDAGFFFTPRGGTGQQDFTGPVVTPDAGSYTWRARGIEDGGLVSAWSASGSFRIDDLAPAIPSSFTASLDAGFLTMTSAATTDLESGLGYYHYGLSRIDQLDGSVTYAGTMDLRSTTVPTLTVLLGPGTWTAGVHVHDAVGNAFVAQSLVVPNLVVNSTTGISAPPPPDVIRGDGGTWATAPYVPIDVVRFRVDAGNIGNVVGYVLSRKGRTETEWELCDYGAGPTIVQTLPAGDQDVRLAVLALNVVSPWSAPVRVFVDTDNPNSPDVRASVDGGAVLLSWPSTRDNFGGSGVLEYRVTRCCVADASVAHPNVPHVPDASITFTDAPGFGAWTWSVSTIDRAAHEGIPTSVVTSIPPNAPTNLRAAQAITNQPLSLAWDEDRDGGFMQTWSLTRLDALDAGTLINGLINLPQLTDDAPEGRWSYELFAEVSGLRSPVARLDGVVRDVTAPVVSVPSVTRLGSRTVEVSWSASDALSGLGSVRLERETVGSIPVDLGAQTSPFSETLAVDGTHHYRVVATDLAGNTATSSFSADFVSPGAGLVIAPVESQTLRCAQTFELDFSASESATWSLLDAPDNADIDATTGHFTWTPSPADEGTKTVRVRAQGASSVDQRDVELTVGCERERYGISCGCTAFDATSVVALACLALLRRRQRD